jgi:ketosteroid isomerase-like protein
VRNLLPRFATYALPLILSLATPLYAQDAPAEIRNLFERYMGAWNDGDLMTIGSVIYKPPLYIFDAEHTQILETAEDIAALLSQVRAGLDEAGFSHSELRGVSICDLGGGLAFASFHYSRFNKEGNEMDESALASAYIVRRYEDGWHLAAHVMQSLPGTLSC